MRIRLEPSDRTALVQGIFSRVVGRYDLMNHVLSLGRDVFWRRAAAKRARLLGTGRFLDLACGTGDLALALVEAHPQARVIGTDFTWPMLEKAKEKIEAGGRPNRPDLAGADALRLPFPDRAFDSVTMAFGIRNIPDRRRALEEMHRVLWPGGRALILELTFPRWSLVRKFYETYLNRLIPKLGGLLTGQPLAYQYLADSIMDFPAPEDFLLEMQRAGFVKTSCLKMTFGIAVLHVGERARA
ncbi:MAG: bifunctional demethylmenaquinone methyltransferase/2-methoxy-6-polyprenyl-1,4-benzoquinol methylase UbiE [Pseudomonadota bacterium]